MAPEWVKACHKHGKLVSEEEYGVQPCVRVLEGKKFFLSEEYKTNSKKERVANTQVLISIGKGIEVQDEDSADYVMVVTPEPGGKSCTFPQFVDMISTATKLQIENTRTKANDKSTENINSTSANDLLPEDEKDKTERSNHNGNTVLESPSKKTDQTARKGRFSSVKKENNKPTNEEKADPSENGKSGDKKADKDKVKEKDRDKEQTTTEKQKTSNNNNNNNKAKISSKKEPEDDPKPTKKKKEEENSQDKKRAATAKKRK